MDKRSWFLRRAVVYNLNYVLQDTWICKGSPFTGTPQRSHTYTHIVNNNMSVIDCLLYVCNIFEVACMYVVYVVCT